MKITRRSFVKKSSYSAAAVTVLGAGVALASGGSSGKKAQATPITGTTPNLTWGSHTLYARYSADPKPTGIGELATAYVTVFHKQGAATAAPFEATFLDGSFDDDGNFETDVSAKTSGSVLIHQTSSFEILYKYFAAYSLPDDDSSDGSRTLSGSMYFVKETYRYGGTDPGPAHIPGYIYQSSKILSQEQLLIKVEDIS